jgi:hypothetical protein
MWEYTVTNEDNSNKFVYMWEQEFVNFGLAKAEGNVVKVYKDKFSYVTLSVGEKVSYAVWAGNELNVFLESGKARRYKNKFSWVNIM